MNYPLSTMAAMAPTTNTDALRADSARARARMLAAARARVSAGDLDLPMNAVAKDAGVGVGTMYRHFPSRQALLEALAAQSLEALVAEAARAAGDPDVAGGVAGLLRSVLRCQLTDPALAEVLAAPDAACPETTALNRELVATTTGLLDRARAAAVIRPDVTADDIRRLLCGVRHAVRIGAADDADRYLDVLLRGLRP